MTTPVQGICPEGWHNDTWEWDLLSLILADDYVAGGLMKDTGTALWMAPKQDATNSSGSRPSRDVTGTQRIFVNLGYNTTYWTSNSTTPVIRGTET
jgi:uncharacterized protein (TIGR02145 family)